jgi:hypothetical protein
LIRIYLKDLPAVAGVIRAGSRPRFVLLEASSFKAYVRRLAPWGAIDEERYLADNEDVARAFADGRVDSPTTHYFKSGYIEGRTAEILPPTEDLYGEAGLHISDMPQVLGVERSGHELRLALLDYSSFKEHLGHVRLSGAIDEQDYMARYADAAAAIAQQKVGSAAAHFARVGYAEGRSAVIL